MEEKIYYICLYDCYGELLTEKQKLYFKDYYFHDLSLSEMSENYEISRNAIHKQLKESVRKLEEYEKKLQLFEKKEKLYDIIKNIEDSEIRKKLEKL